jgi:hypothetical protein
MEVTSPAGRMKDAQWRDMLGDLGQALLDSQPRQCSGRIGPNASFSRSPRLRRRSLPSAKKG